MDQLRKDIRVLSIAALTPAPCTECGEPRDVLRESEYDEVYTCPTSGCDGTPWRPVRPAVPLDLPVDDDDFLYGIGPTSDDDRPF